MRRHLTPPKPVAADIALWAVFATAGALWFGDARKASVAWDLVLPLTALGVAVALSRWRRPGAAVLLANCPCAVGLAGSESPANVYALTLACMSFLLGARTATARVPLLVLAGCLTADLAVLAVLRAPAVWWFYAMTMLPAALLLPWLAGRYWRTRRELVEGGWQLARGLEERQHLAAERARLAERAAIAADMHDSLGHVLSLVALRAGALELSPTLTTQDRDDVAELRRSVSDAVDHLRETVTVLRADPRPGADSATTDTVEELLGRAIASGVPVRWERGGSPPTRSPLVERAVYRVIQEALTNAAKHAPGSTVHVTITHAADATRVRVVNTPPEPVRSPGPPLLTSSGNHGLAGLRERVTVLGGTLRAGPYEDGFEVAAVLPHHAPAQAPPPDTADLTGLPTPADRAAPAAEMPLSVPESVPESVRRQARIRRSARWRFAAALAAPAAVAVVFLPSAAYLAHQLTGSVLSPSRYEEMRVGTPRAELVRILPRRPFPYAPDSLRAAPRPPGTTCDFYRSNGNVLDDVDLYRLCYSGGRLVAKDTLNAGDDTAFPS
ncbi:MULTISPECIES: sensor histidine kinase [Streptomyces]|uniref:sensor histidine kinase n=1 Tax=Streptomyces TaxID=1883 RepID=UPI001E5ECB37|nr:MULTISPECIES: histidine kinase [Streptomyces]UFQ19634.1 histidine kinase [Streptomyces huasconensis]WCL89253.1 histidine kinase [Streptomyces sp. JCM 35825]